MDEWWKGERRRVKRRRLKRRAKGAHDLNLNLDLVLNLLPGKSPAWY
jgi:hypothetical protein